jgi:RNA polymerase sigma-70 factor, ECF subfamily
MQAELLTPTTTRTQPDDERTANRVLERSDEQLMADYAETGDRASFEELVHRYERKLYGYLRRTLGDSQLAEDAFQATFLQVHLKCKQFAPGRRLRPWLYAIASNQAVDLMRRNRRHKTVSLSVASADGHTGDQRHPLADVLQAEAADPVERLGRLEDRRWLRLALKKIPAKARQVLLLIVYRGLSYQETAETLGVPLGTVKSRMNSALPSLRRALLATRPGFTA